MSIPTILIIDDYLPTLETVGTILTAYKYQVITAGDGPTGLEKMKSNSVDLVLLDVKMPGMDGFEVIDKLKREKPQLPVVIISAHDAQSTALRSAGMGAFEFLEKPLDTDKLLSVVKSALENSRSGSDNKKSKGDIEGTFDIIGVSKPIQQIRELIYRVARTEARVLITGENGTGKELVARAIHRHSGRNQKPLIEINCAAIPSELIESELFGHEKGAFTGASQQRIGKFELANGGTLFLDEIGDMSLPAQAKVLRALQNHIIQRVGGTENIEVDVRVIAATNKNLREEITDGRFREDLYHRLNVIPIVVPPLRDRREDISILVRHFIRQIAAEQSLPVSDISQSAIDLLQRLDWKGNVRELQNMAERLVIMAHGPVIDDGDVQLFLPGDQIPSPQGDSGLFDNTDNFQEFKDLSEKLFIEKKLEKYGWNISKTAEALDIQRSHLYNKIDKYKIRRNGDSE